MSKDQIVEEVRRLPRDEQMDVLERIVQIVAPPLAKDEEDGLAEAMDSADAGDLVDGDAAMKRLRDRARGPG